MSVSGSVLHDRWYRHSCLWHIIVCCLIKSVYRNIPLFFGFNVDFWMNWLRKTGLSLSLYPSNAFMLYFSSTWWSADFTYRTERAAAAAADKGGRADVQQDSLRLRLGQSAKAIRTQWGSQHVISEVTMLLTSSLKVEALSTQQVRGCGKGLKLTCNLTGQGEGETEGRGQ